jgi:hypothetical protein
MKPQRNFDAYQFLIITMVVVGVGFFLASVVLSRILFSEKDGEMEKEPRQVVIPRSPSRLPVEAPAPEKGEKQMLLSNR